MEGMRLIIFCLFVWNLVKGGWERGGAKCIGSTTADNIFNLDLRVVLQERVKKPISLYKGANFPVKGNFFLNVVSTGLVRLLLKEFLIVKTATTDDIKNE